MIVNANAMSIPLADKTVQCVVTSPPYWGLRDYSVEGQLGLEPTPEEYVANMVQVFREVRRVLRKDGVCWLNLGDSYAGGNQTGRNDNGRPEKDRGWAEYDIRRTKIERNDGLKPKDLVGIPWRVAFALQADGWWLRSDIIWHKPNPMPESVTDRPTKAHEYMFLLTKAASYYYDQEAVKENGTSSDYDINKRKPGRMDGNNYMVNGAGYNPGETFGTANGSRNRRTVWTIPTSPYSGSHFATFPPDLVRPCILAGTSPRACEKCGAPWERVVERESHYEKRQERDAPSWKGPQVDSSGWRPPTVKDNGFRPTCTCDNQGTGRCIVLDPFAGTFTVGMVAAEYGRRAVGLELNPEYIKLALERTAKARAQGVMPL